MQEYSKRTIGIIKSGAGQPFWQALKGIFQAQAEDLKEQILNDDSLSERITVTRRELAIELYKWKMEILSTPENVVKSIEGGKTEPRDFDPYPRELADIMRMVDKV